ncbi:TetR/AcrR family transcriptional regulator [bacterium]|nr:TetR/AcrR family transcriptional regulator [bacterium]
MPRPRSFDADEVLAGAVAMFRAHGYERTSVPELTERLGICRQSLYATFGDKRGLYLQALAAWGRDEVDGKLALLAAEGSPLAHVRTLVRGFAALASTCPAAGCFTVTAMVESRDDPEAVAVVAAQVARFEDGLHAALAEARAGGELRPDADPRRLARTITTAMYGLGLVVRLPDSAGRIADTVATLLALLDEAAAGRSG